MTAGKLRERLRTETADRHAALERTLDLPASLDGPARATALLSRFAGFYRTLEPALDRALGAAIMAGRHRRADLEHDLAALGVVPARRDGIPRAPDTGAFTTAGSALGALYVIEGARLGTQLIGRALAARDWLPPGGLRFWAAAGDPARWRSLLALLEDADDPDAVVAGAALCFAELHEWLAPVALAPASRHR